MARMEISEAELFASLYYCALVSNQEVQSSNFSLLIAMRALKLGSKLLYA